MPEENTKDHFKLETIRIAMEERAKVSKCATEIIGGIEGSTTSSDLTFGQRMTDLSEHLGNLAPFSQTFTRKGSYCRRYHRCSSSVNNDCVSSRF